MSFINPKWSLVYDGMKRIGEGDRKKWLSVLAVVFWLIVIVAPSPINFSEHNLKMAKDQEIF